MKKKCTTAFDGQFLSSFFSDTAERRFISLEPEGVPDVLAIVHSRFDHIKVSPGAHKHSECYELGICLRGALTLFNNGNEHRLLPGDIFINKPHDLHCLSDCPPGTKIYCIIFRTSGKKGKLLRFTPQETTALCETLNRLPCHIVTNATGVKDAFRRLFSEYENSCAPFRSFCLSTACADLIMAFIKDSATHQKNLPRNSKLQEIIEEMREYPKQPFNLATLARQAKMPAAALIIQFRLLTGLPPYQFQLACRLDKAKLLLTTTDLPITQIAFDLGFCASQHSSSHFKRAFGVTPTAWRKENG